MAEQRWQAVCNLDDIVPDTGVAALVAGRQVAIFRLRKGDGLYAIDNHDPFSGANVLARGLVGDLQGEPVVASPIYKQHFSLATGRCLEQGDRAVAAYAVRCTAQGVVEVGIEPMATNHQPRPHEAERLVVVGAGQGVVATIEALLEMAPGRYHITMLDAGPAGLDGMALAAMVAAGQGSPTMPLPDEAWCAPRGIVWHGGEVVQAIDLARAVVQTQSGPEHPYDRLLLATGTVQPVAPWQQGLAVLRGDSPGAAAALVAATSFGQAIAVLGDTVGAIALAWALARRGAAVTLLASAGQLLAGLVDDVAANWLHDQLQAGGVAVMLDAVVSAAVPAAQGLELVLRDGRSLHTDLVVDAGDAKPDIALAQRCGLHCDVGIVVDEVMQTSQPGVYAVGACAQHHGTCHHDPDVVRLQARTIAAQLGGETSQWLGAQPVVHHLQLGDEALWLAGTLQPEAAGEVLVLHDAALGLYRRLVISANRLQGALLCGAVDEAPWYLDLIRSAASIGIWRSRLAFGPGAAAMP
jgi:nitrite reductase (NADH) large subunit